MNCVICHQPIVHRTSLSPTCSKHAYLTEYLVATKDGFVLNETGKKKLTHSG